MARNDRNRTHNGVNFQDIPHLRKDLPRQFDDATNRTIELIDVLWLQGDAIIAAFKVEHPTCQSAPTCRGCLTWYPCSPTSRSTGGGAPDDRRDIVAYEINRPTFARLKPPLPRVCRFIPYSELKREIEQIASRIRYMKPEFIGEIAESSLAGGGVSADGAGRDGLAALDSRDRPARIVAANLGRANSPAAF